MTNRTRYYIPSRIAPIGGLITAGCIGIAAAVVLGIVYSLLNHFNPFIYISFLATIGFGAILGAAVTKGSTIGHIRSPAMSYAITLFSGVVGVYVAWIGQIFLVTEAKVFVFDPLIIFAAIQAFAEIGVWELRGFQPKGWQLYACWSIEAIMIIGFAYVSGGGSEDPYCERCGKWTEPNGHITRLALASDLEIRTALEEDYGILTSLASQEVDDANYLDVSVHCCGSCDESNFMSLDRVAITVDSKGEVQVSTDSVVKCLIAPRSLTEGLVQLAKSSDLDEDNDSEEPSEPHQDDADSVS